MFLKYPVGMDLIAGLRDFPRQLKVPTLDWAVSAHLQCSETWFTSVRVRPHMLRSTPTATFVFSKDDTNQES